MMPVTASDKRRQQENRVELVEHLPYKQRVIGSSPIGSISISYLFYGEIAQLARACGSYPQCRGFFFTVPSQLSVKFYKKMKKGKPNPENCVTLDLFVISMRRR